MLQELEMLVEHNIRDFVLQILLSYRPTDSGETYCFYLPLQEGFQHRTHVHKDSVKQLIQYLQVYVEKLETEENTAEIVEPDWDSQRGWKAPVDTNPTRD